MSSVPKSEELTIEEVLEQIRRQASAAPPLGAAPGDREAAWNGANRSATNEDRAGASPQRARYAVGKGNGVVSADAPADQAGRAAGSDWDEQLAVGPVANDDATDLPSLLRRPAETLDTQPTTARVHAFPRAKANRLTDALRKVRTARPPNPDEVVRGSGAAQQPVRWEMPSFLDTRFKKLSEMPAHTPSSPQPQKPPDPLRARPLTPEQSATLQSVLDRLHAAGPDDLVRTQRDTQELLRPILKQWLLENMPRLIEQALITELAENVGRTEIKRTV